MRMHWILRGAAKQEAKPSPATNSREDSTFGGLPTVGSVHISCNERGLCLAFELKMTIAAFLRDGVLCMFTILLLGKYYI